MADETFDGVAEFKSRYPALLDKVARGRVGRLVPRSEEMPELRGALRGSVLVSPGTDLTGPTGEVWEADV